MKALAFRRPSAEQSARERLDDFLWTIHALSDCSERLCKVWSNALGVSIPQWRILKATRDLDTGAGASITRVAKKVLADASFVTVQSKNLEIKRLLVRSRSPVDARIVTLALSESCKRGMSEAVSLYHPTRDAIAEEIGELLEDQNDRLPVILHRLDRAARRLKAEI